MELERLHSGLCGGNELDYFVFALALIKIPDLRFEVRHGNGRGHLLVSEPERLQFGKAGSDFASAAHACGEGEVVRRGLEMQCSLAIYSSCTCMTASRSCF